MSKSRIMIASMTAIMLLSGCRVNSSPAKASTATISIEDDLGRKVVLPINPTRVISLSPEATEIIYALGAEKSLIAVVNESDYPLQAKDLPKVGSFSSPSYEAILELAPDLVIATGHEQASFVGKLESVGVNVFAIYPKDITALQMDIKMLGTILGCSEESIRLVGQINDGLSEVQRIVATLHRPKVFIEIADQPLMTVSNGSFVDQLINIAGGENIASNLPRPYCRIEPEQVLIADPEVIILAHTSSTVEGVANRPGWSNIAAIRNGRLICDIDPSLVFRAGPRLVSGARALAQAFHPELNLPRGK